MMLVFTNYKLTDGLGCKFSMYISYRKKIKSWAIGYTHREHNHAMNPDPFSYNIHRSQRVGFNKAVELAKGLRGEVSYKKAKAILKNHDLKMERKEFYNLTRKETTKKLNTQEELCLLLACLDEEDFRVRFHKVYTLNDEGN